MIALIPTAMAAALLVWLMYRVAAPLLRRKTPTVTISTPDPGTAFLHQMLDTERAKLAGLEQLAGPEPEEVHDEAAHLPPLPPVQAKRGRRRSREHTADVQPKLTRKQKSSPTTTKRDLSTLARGIRIPAQFEYLGGRTPGRTRKAVIISAVGYTEDDGSFDVTTLRCICADSQDWRAFQIDRIRNFVELEHGELVPDLKEWAAEMVALKLDELL